jgi:hypothetical protein
VSKQAACTSLLGALALVLLLLAVMTSVAEDKEAPGDANPQAGCYLCVFAYETTPRRPAFAHTFATFIRSDGKAFDSQTISWFPKSNRVRLVRRFSEPGINLDLKRTFENAKVLQAQVSMWGPYPIKRELYDKAQEQIKKLNSGQVQYKALDITRRAEEAINCIHAVADIDTGRGFLVTGTSFGSEASAQVVEHLKPWILQSGKKYPWIIERLGLAKDSFVQK